MTSSSLFSDEVRPGFASPGLALILVLTSLAPGTAPGATLMWGPNYECLRHGELAKEGLAVDNQHRSFSVGFSDRWSQPFAQALLMVRDGAGSLLSFTQWSAPLTQVNVAAGLWVHPGGAMAITVGTAQTGNVINPTQLVLTRWAPGPGIPWTNPVQTGMNVLTPSLLGLKGSEAWGCRVIGASPNDVFVSGCSDTELFVLRIDKTTLGLVPSWGTGGVQTVVTPSPGGAPIHEMPGAFGWFLSYRQSFLELVGGRLYLGGTLHANGIDHDFVVACYKASTGALELPFGIRWSGGKGDEYMKAMAATAGGVYATGTLDPYGAPQAEVIAWRPDGQMRAPGIVTAPTPSRGNDVEATPAAGGFHVVVGGYGPGPAKFSTGLVWHFRHGLLPGNALQLPAQWNGPFAGGPNPKTYGPAVDPYDEVFDLAIGSGAHHGHVFATGQAWLGPGDFGQPLLVIAPNGLTTFSNNPNPLAPMDDRGVAVEYQPGPGGEVFTHGTAADTVAGFWQCAGHWVSRHSRFQP